MRYGYAQLHNNEDELSSSKLFFSNILDTDWIFLDHESDMHAMAAMLRKVQKNDQVVLQSRSDCGLSAGEIHELEQLLLKKKVRFFLLYLNQKWNLLQRRSKKNLWGKLPQNREWLRNIVKYVNHWIIISLLNCISCISPER